MQISEQLGLQISPELKSMFELINNQKQAVKLPNKISDSPKYQMLVSEHKQLLNQFREIVLLLKELAKALGACPECWGTELKCLNCSGNGTTGFTIPDPVLYQKIVQPAINTIKQKEIQNSNQIN